MTYTVSEAVAPQRAAPLQLLSLLHCQLRHFAIIDKASAKDKTLVVCKIGDKDLKSDQVDYRRYPAHATAWLGVRGMGRDPSEAY